MVQPSPIGATSIVSPLGLACQCRREIIFAPRHTAWASCGPRTTRGASYREGRHHGSGTHRVVTKFPPARRGGAQGARG